MKKFYLMAFSALLLSSCSKDETGLNSLAGGEIVKLTSAISDMDEGIQTRTGDTPELTHFPELVNGTDQHIVIFMDVDDDTNNPGGKRTMLSDENGNLSIYNNDPYQFPEDGGTVSFYSVWPNNGKLGTTGSAFSTIENIEYVVGTNNEEEEQPGRNKDLSPYDVLVAVEKNVEPSANPVKLNYYHMLSNISVALKKGIGTWNNNELENAIVKVYVPKAKTIVKYPSLKSVDDLSTAANRQKILQGNGGNANYIFKIDTYVCEEFGDYGNYARAIVASRQNVNSSNASIKIYRNAEDSNPMVVPFPSETDVLLDSNQRYIFNITVNKQDATSAARSNGVADYSVGSCEMLVQDWSTGEILE